jgi:uncharacterized protein YpmS
MSKNGWDKVSDDIDSGPMGLWKWSAIIIIAIGVTFGAANFIFKPMSMATDRMVMKNSFQYKEGMEQQAALLEAQIAEIDVNIARYPSKQIELMNQRKVFQARLKAITVNQ